MRGVHCQAGQRRGAAQCPMKNCGPARIHAQEMIAIHRRVQRDAARRGAGQCGVGLQQHGRIVGRLPLVSTAVDEAARK